MTEANRKSLEQMKAQFAEIAMSEDPVKRALAQYVERVGQHLGRAVCAQRDGATSVYFKTDGQDSSQKQMLVSL